MSETNWANEMKLLATLTGTKKEKEIKDTIPEKVLCKNCGFLLKKANVCEGEHDCINKPESKLV